MEKKKFKKEELKSFIDFHSEHLALMLMEKESENSLISELAFGEESTLNHYRKILAEFKDLFFEVFAEFLGYDENTSPKEMEIEKEQISTINVVVALFSSVIKTS